MVIKDSGNRREFNSGAVRDIAEGKGRCDLLPLDVVAEVTEDVIPALINRFVRSGNEGSLLVALELFAKQRYGDIYTAVLEVSKHYEDGCKKYGERNWEKGIPLHCFIDSAMRHYVKHKRGDVDEPHDRAFMWNILGALWTHNNKPDCCDLPFVEKRDRND